MTLWLANVTNHNVTQVLPNMFTIIIIREMLGSNPLTHPFKHTHSFEATSLDENGQDINMTSNVVYREVFHNVS
jgi:hypothetical protein